MFDHSEEQRKEEEELKEKARKRLEMERKAKAPGGTDAWMFECLLFLSTMLCRFARTC